MKRLKYFLLPIIVFIIFIFTFSNIISIEAKKLLDKKNLTYLKHLYGSVEKDRGKVLKDEMHKEGDLMLLGSSELASPVEQNPINVFPFYGAEYDISIYGRAYTQSLQHATILSNIDNLNNKDKIAIIISPQWFENQGGINGEDFLVNFSEKQFYDFFNNENISNENKTYYAKRISELLRNNEEYNEERIYARLYCEDSYTSKLGLSILKPYYKFKNYMLDIKDKTKTISLIKNREDKSKENIKDINWEDEYKKAENEGKSKVTNNDIYVDDEYYDTYLRDVYSDLKNRWGDVDLIKSQELEDYKFLLSICKENNAKPLIILPPVNGLYYDHLGLSKDKRTKFYKEVESMAKEQGFDVLNLQNKEYEKYYLKDVMHLGWKGWLSINEEIYKYFKEK